MPRKRRVAKLRARVPRWDDVDVGQMMDFWSGWHPPTKGESSAWQTWEDYLSHWAAVRVDALPEWDAKRVEMRAHARAKVAHYREELNRAPERDRDVYEPLLAQAREWLEEEERRELPFAEFVLRQVEAGQSPDEAAVAYRVYRHGLDGSADDDDWLG
jgi:hypothetical protein